MDQGADEMIQEGENHFHWRCYSLIKKNNDLASVLSFVNRKIEEEESPAKDLNQVRRYIWELVK